MYAPNITVTPEPSYTPPSPLNPTPKPTGTRKRYLA